MHDRLLVGDRRAEVEREDLTQVLDVLDEDVAVVARLVDALGQLVGREATAEGGGDRVARHPDEEEHERHQDQDGREDEQEPDQDVPSERAPAGSAASRDLKGGRRLGDRSVDGHGCLPYGTDPRAPGFGARGSGRVSYLVMGAKRSLNDASRVTPLTSLPVTAT